MNVRVQREWEGLNMSDRAVYLEKELSGQAEFNSEKEGYDDGEILSEILSLKAAVCPQTNCTVSPLSLSLS